MTFLLKRAKLRIHRLLIQVARQQAADAGPVAQHRGHGGGPGGGAGESRDAERQV